MEMPLSKYTYAQAERALNNITRTAADQVRGERARLATLSPAAFMATHGTEIEPWELDDVRDCITDFHETYCANGLYEGLFIWPPEERERASQNGRLRPFALAPLRYRPGITLVFEFLEKRLPPHYMVVPEVGLVRGMPMKSCPTWLAGEYSKIVLEAARNRSMLSAVPHLRTLFEITGYPGAQTPDFADDAYSARHYKQWRDPVEALKSRWPPEAELFGPPPKSAAAP